MHKQQAQRRCLCAGYAHSVRLTGRISAQTGAAELRRLVLITDEQRRTTRRQKSQNILHIPDICDQLGIRGTNLAGMLSTEGIP